MKRCLLLIVLASFMVLPMAAQKGPKRDVKQLEAELSQARDSLALALQECNRLLGQLSAIDTLRSLAAQSMIQEFSSYPSRAFHAIEPAVVDSIRFFGERLFDAQVNQLLTNIDSTMQRREVYLQGCNLLEQEFDKSAVDSVLVLIDGISSLCTPGQQAELEDVATRLKLFPVAMEKAFDVADWMADTLKDLRAEGDPTTTSNAVALANSIFKDQDFEYRSSISKIPYMDRLYQSYKKAILENPLQVGPEEQQLLTYKY